MNVQAKGEEPIMTDTDNIYKATCVACGYSTINPKILHILLEVDCECLACGDGGINFAELDDPNV